MEAGEQPSSNKPDKSPETLEEPQSNHSDISPKVLDEKNSDHQVDSECSNSVDNPQKGSHAGSVSSSDISSSDSNENEDNLRPQCKSDADESKASENLEQMEEVTSGSKANIDIYKIDENSEDNTDTSTTHQKPSKAINEENSNSNLEQIKDPNIENPPEGTTECKNFGNVSNSSQSFTEANTKGVGQNQGSQNNVIELEENDASESENQNISKIWLSENTEVRSASNIGTGERVEEQSKSNGIFINMFDRILSKVTSESTVNEKKYEPHIDDQYQQEAPEQPTLLTSNFSKQNQIYDSKATNYSVELPEGEITDLNDKREIISFSFNYDSSKLVCSTSCGFRVHQCMPLSLKFCVEPPRSQSQSVWLVKTFFQTPIFVIVLTHSKNLLHIWNSEPSKSLLKLRLSKDILQVVTSKEIFAVVSYDKIYIIDTEKLTYRETISTGPNSYGLCAISNGLNGNYNLICPTNLEGGLRIVPSGKTQNSFIIRAHRTSLVCINISPDGQYFATASVLGTKIRVFSAVSGDQLHELRRGTQHIAISSLVFRSDNAFLCVASSSSTVHIFRLYNVKANAQNTHKHNQPLTQMTSNSDIVEPDPKSPDASDTVNNPVPESSSLIKPNHKVSEATQRDESSTRSPSHITKSWFNASGFELHPLTEMFTKNIKDSILNTRNIEPSFLKDSLNVLISSLYTQERSFAQFHLPENHDELSMIAPYSKITGPICAFAGENSTHVFLVHTNGIFYEFEFDPENGENCQLLAATPWFSSRSSFSIKHDHSQDTNVATFEGIEQEWHLL